MLNNVKNNLKTVSLFTVILIFGAAVCFAQTDSEISLSGILQKQKTEKKYSVGEFNVQNKRADDEPSIIDELKLDGLVGKEVRVKGKKIGEKTVEIEEINDVVSQPTEPDYPSLAPAGKTIDDFIPKGWTILAKTTEDLNQDDSDDAVLIIKSNYQKFVDFYDFDPRGNPQSFVNPQTGTTFSGYDGNPRILLVLLKNENGYNLFLQNNSFVPTPRFPMGETLENIQIQNGELLVKFKWSDNHWVYGNSTHTFKYIGAEIVLTKYDVLIMRNAGYGDAKIYDFPGGKMTKIKIEKHDGKETKTVEEKRIKPASPFSLKTLDYVGEIEEI